MTRPKVRWALAAILLAAGCRSDLSQQLLERELRMQEDQIYQLQDELNAKCSRLDRLAGENTSLRRQLGFQDGDAQPTPARGPAVPPARQPAPRSQPPAAPVEMVAPPALEGVPPLPAGPSFPGANRAAEPTVIRASATAPAAPPGDGPTGPPLSDAESLAASGRITHLVLNASRTECFAAGDGSAGGLALVVEPRDDDERLVTAAGDVTVTVHDAAMPPGGPPLAHYEIPAAEAVARFRRTSRNRGLHFVLPWPGETPRGDHVRVHVALTSFEGAGFETEGTVPTRPGGFPAR
jgi:hypothetical protein